MAIDRVNDLFAFKSFIEEKLANGGASPPRWTKPLPAGNTRTRPRRSVSAEVDAVREALDDMRAGDSGTPAHRIPRRPPSQVPITSSAMSYSVKILARAKEDLETIVAWIAAHRRRELSG